MRRTLGVLGVFGLSAVSLVMAACRPDPPPLGHVVVWLDTDAPVPSLIDAARVEIRTAGGDVLASREIGLDEQRLREGSSFVVAPELPEHASGIVVHVTMWLAATGRAAPVASESLEGWFALPPAPAEGALDVTLALGLDAVGAPLGTAEAPLAAVPGHAPSRVGTWPGALRRPCAGEAREGEVCVPGGAFWMGHPRLGNLGIGSADHTRLVVLSPFFLDVDDVSVAAYRRDGKVYAGRWSGVYGGGEKDQCTFTDSPGDHDGLPVNCVRWEPAREYCTSIGKDLPTESQLELVATRFGTALHPWGDDLPRCGDAVYGRGGSAAVLGFPPTCKAPGTSPRERLGSPEPVVRASYGRDVVQLPDGSGELHDLFGNLSKWALDMAALQDDPCWQPRSPNVFVDPVCTTPSPSLPPRSRAIRGTAFFMPPLQPAFRGSQAEGAFLEVGFRCARRGVE